MSREVGSPQVRFQAEAPLEGVDAELVQAVVERVWRLHRGPPGATLEVVLLDEREHTEHHARFLDDPAPTDVMAFPYGDPDLFGEILVNRDMCVREAVARGISPVAEARLYVAHGALHLLGFRDDTDEARARMRAAEAQVLEGWRAT